MKDAIGLYIHIPFCKQKCAYCDFSSFVGKEAWYASYIEAVQQELQARVKIFGSNLVCKSIFVGGGTPTVLPIALLEALMQGVRQCIQVQEDAEITIEANPGTLDEKMAHALYQMGFNRLSMGVQAWQNHHLKALGRIHDIAMFEENFAVARKAGFTNMSADFMFGLPNQTREEWQESIEQIILKDPEHISIYALIIEEGTPFYDAYEAGTFTEMEEELDRTLYDDAIRLLKQAGYEQYEISNFAKPGYESRHNQIYWQTTPYLGIGLGAHSYIEETRFSNTEDLEAYITYASDLEAITTTSECVKLQDAISEFMFLGLRCTVGIRFDVFKERFGLCAKEVFGKEIAQCVAEGLLEADDVGICLTRRGMDLSNLVFSRFLLEESP